MRVDERHTPSSRVRSTYIGYLRTPGTFLSMGSLECFSAPLRRKRAKQVSTQCDLFVSLPFSLSLCISLSSHLSLPHVLSPSYTVSSVLLKLGRGLCLEVVLWGLRLSWRKKAKKKETYKQAPCSHSPWQGTRSQDLCLKRKKWTQYVGVSLRGKSGEGGKEEPLNREGQ